MERRLQRLLVRLGPCGLLSDAVRMLRTGSRPRMLSGVPGWSHLPPSGEFEDTITLFHNWTWGGNLAIQQGNRRSESRTACNVCSCPGNWRADLCARPEVDTQLHGVRMPGEPTFILMNCALSFLRRSQSVSAY